MQEGNTRKFKYSEGSMQAYWRTFEYMYTGKYREEPCIKLNYPGTLYTPNHGTTMWVDSA